jgi:hypothetical protein
MLPLLETFLEPILGNNFQCRRHFFFLDVFNILKSSSLLMQTLFLETEVIRRQIRETGWMFHFSNPFLGQKVLDRERLVSWRIFTVENPLVGLKFRPFS